MVKSKSKSKNAKKGTSDLQQQNSELLVNQTKNSFTTLDKEAAVTTKEISSFEDIERKIFENIHCRSRSKKLTQNKNSEFLKFSNNPPKIAESIKITDKQNDPVQSLKYKKAVKSKLDQSISKNLPKKNVCSKNSSENQSRHKGKSESENKTKDDLECNVGKANSSAGNNSKKCEIPNNDTKPDKISRITNEKSIDKSSKQKQSSIPDKSSKEKNNSKSKVNSKGKPIEKRKPDKISRITDEKSIDKSSKQKQSSVSDKSSKEKNNSKSKANSKGKHIEKRNSKHKLVEKSHKVVQDESSTDTDDNDWEDVDEFHELLEGKKQSADNQGNVQIELRQESLLWGYKKRKSKTKEQIIEDYVRKHVNRSIKEIHENMHKTHLLSLFAHGIYVNRVLSSENLVAAAISIIPNDYFSPKRFDLSHLEKFVNWYSKIMVVEPKCSDNDYSRDSLEEILLNRLEKKSVCTNRELVLLFVLISRCVGMNVRLVFSFYPLSWKPSADNLLKPKRENNSPEANEPLSSKDLSNPAIKESKLKKSARKIKASDSEPELQSVKTPTAVRKVRKQPKLSDDKDFELEEYSLKKPAKVGACSKSKRKSIEENEASAKKRKSEVLGQWAEVYVEEEEIWIAVDITSCKIHCVKDIRARSPSTLAYVIAYNADQTVKDVTKRYVPSWLSHRDKIRCDHEWWEKSLKPFLGGKTRKDRDEDEEMEENLRKQPLPKTVSEYKNHSLYALQRHLLKFEAIYPPDASAVGFLKGEPVYPRECIKTLFGREYWIKEAKVVRVGEEPYKIVKARPKWDRLTCQVIKDRPLELFGDWQVEDYEPPLAKNGKVPRNEYGNVDLFKPSMVPRGCVHIPINGLSRIARKLNIDCAPAVVGFEFRSGGSYPVYDGYVLCEEVKDVIIDAWSQDQVEQARRQEEKKLKRIYNNWKKLINSVILKEKIKEKYGSVDQTRVNDADNNCEAKEEKPKKKIKQEDLSAALPNCIKHYAPTLKIDFDSSVAGFIGQAQKGKPKQYSRGSKGRSSKKTDTIAKNISKFHDKSNDIIGSLMSSSDSEDNITAAEKREQIRKILDWNPVMGAGGSDPDLSNDSDELYNKGTATAPYQQPNRNAKVRKRGKKIKGKNKVLQESDCSNSQESLSEGSTTSSSVAAAPLGSGKRRTRNAKLNISYKEEGDSQSDISIDNSDTGDQTYDPIKDKEKMKKAASLLDLSEDSDV